MGAQYEPNWNALFAKYKQEFPELAAEYERVLGGKAEGWMGAEPAEVSRRTRAGGDAHRGNTVMNAYREAGAGADWAERRILSTSTKTMIKDSGNFHLDASGQNVSSACASLACAPLVNGMAAHGGRDSLWSTFFVFRTTASRRFGWRR